MINNKYITESVEAALLFNVIQSEGYLLDVIEQLTPEDFGAKNTNAIYTKIYDLFSQNKTIDRELLDSQLTHEQQSYLSELLTKTYKTDKDVVHNYIKEIKSRSLLRKGFQLSNFIKDELNNPNQALSGSELLEKIQLKLDSYFADELTQIQTIGENLFDVIPNPDMYDPDKKMEYTGIRSYIDKLDEFITEFHAGIYALIAGRPSAGKSLFMRQILLNNCYNHNIPVLLFSIDEDEAIVRRKIVSSITGINYNNLKRHELNKTELELLKKSIARIKEMPFLLDNSPALTIASIRAKIKKTLYRYPNLKAVAIDYVQQLGVNNEELTQVSKGIKDLTREFKLPFLIISQLSRKPENREQEDDEKWYDSPKLSDIRGSGSIEQDLDTAIFVKAEPHKQEDGTYREKRRTRFFILKQRDGEAGVYFDMFLLGKTQKFEKLDNGHVLNF